MVIKLADNITSPLGNTTAENLCAVQAGRSALCTHQQWQIPEPFMASLFAEGQLSEHTYEGALRQSITEAMSQLPADALVGKRVALILSSTKGQTTGPEGETLGETAQRLAQHFGIETLPITVSNACISGLSAQILAMRLLQMGSYDIAIVSGCDIQTKFIVSGFQSFHAVSDEECRPFDEDRFGLNLGEAAATIIYARADQPQPGQWSIESGAVRNDAFHISGPSKTAEGSYRSLRQALSNVDTGRLACLSVHGTATLYNDDMESKAIGRAALTDVLVSALKGYYGHTMGAAGLLETALTMQALDHGIVPGTRGYAACGTTVDVQLSPEAVATGKRSFVKMMSGFGGCNGAALFTKHASQDTAVMLQSPSIALVPNIEARATIVITPDTVILNGETIATEGQGKSMLTALYKQHVGDYPKYYKMDPLSRLGFIASELLIHSLGEETSEECEDRAIVLVNSSASIAADRKYEETIQEGENYFPSPADFVYTLPNIVTGEIAIRHHYHGETTFCVLPRYDEIVMHQLMTQAFLDPMTQSVLGGWLECPDEEHFEARLSLYKR